MPFCSIDSPIEQKGINFDHDFGYSFHLLSSLLKKREEEKENEKQNRAFLIDPLRFRIHGLASGLIKLYSSTNLNLL